MVDVRDFITITSVKNNQTDTHILNVVVEWLTLLLRIQQVPGSNLGLETGYPD
jgi:hypothetical protein